MTTGQEKTTQALKYCIQMEIDGKEFYLKACKDSTSELGKKLLASLAQQEDFHRQKFEEIFAKIGKSNKWPAVIFQPDAGKVLKTIFAEATARFCHSGQGGQNRTGSRRKSDADGRQIL